MSENTYDPRVPETVYVQAVDSPGAKVQKCIRLPSSIDKAGGIWSSKRISSKLEPLFFILSVTVTKVFGATRSALKTRLIPSSTLAE